MASPIGSRVTVSNSNCESFNGAKVVMIKNQNLADLNKFAGDRVTVTGDLTGDTITITKIAAAK